MKHINTQKLYNYWRSLNKGALPPNRYDIQPAEISAHLPDIFLIDRSGHDNTISLAGSRMCTLFDRELRGEQFAGLFAAQDQNTPIAVCNTVANEKVPALFGLLAHTRDSALSIETIMLPLIDNDNQINSMICMFSPMSKPNWIGHKQVIGLEVLSFRVIWPESATNYDPHEVAKYPEGGIYISPGSSEKSANKRNFRVIQGGLSNE